MNALELNAILKKEIDALKNLLKLLEEQHRYLLKNDLFELEEIVQRIQFCNKEVAEAEVERRKITSGQSMREIVNSLNVKDLEDSYRYIKKLLFSTKLQKDTNELLIRQGLGFSTRMLSVLNPDRNTKTYNSYGKIKR